MHDNLFIHSSVHFEITFTINLFLNVPDRVFRFIVFTIKTEIQSVVYLYICLEKGVLD